MTGLEDILERLQRCITGEQWDASEVFLHRQRHLAIQSKDEKVDSLERADTSGLALRVEQNGCLGFAYTTDFSEEALRRLVQNALASAQTVEPKSVQSLPHIPPESAGPTLQQFDSGLAVRPLSDKIAKVIALEAAGRRYDPRISHVRMCTYEESTDEILLWNSRFGARHFERTLCQLHGMVMAADASSQESAWNIGFSPFFEQLDPVAIAEEAADEAVRMLGAGTMSTGSYPALLDRAVVAQCLGILAPSFLADSVQKQKSHLAGRLGQRVYSEAVTLYDDGLYPQGVMTAPCDAEGVPSQTTRLVGNGRLEAYLYDTISGQVDGRPSTGNSVRETFKEMPRSGTRNFYLKPGQATPQTLLTEMQRGVQIQDVIGIHTANPITGDFSVGAAGFRVEGGQWADPIRGFAISGNLHDILADVEAVGDDLKFYGSVGAPTLRIAKLDLGGT